MDKDDRFKHVSTDPKFKTIPKSERKVKIDKRFQSMFKDEKFKLKYTVDKRGRPVSHTSTEDLKRYYELNSEDESESSKEESEEEVENTDLEKTKSGDGTVSKKIKEKLKDLTIDYARGECAVVSDSSSDDEESEEEFSDSEEVEHCWGELDKDADTTDEVTRRLAVCNQDWDRIRAVDLMVLFNSFVPTGGIIHSVTVYPSDFGLQRMKEEETKGPIELTQDEPETEETEEGSKYHMEKLRQYQLNRLKYYYAVVVCDNCETANKIYTECDGMEYESSATKIDLRFIPDDMEFENTPKDICDKFPERYEPRFFTTTALQQAKVELTWDETNPERLEINKKLTSGKIDDVTEADLQAYLASSSSDEQTDDDTQEKESDDDNENPIDKYRSLLQEIEDSKTKKKKENNGVEMEVTWGLDVKVKTEKLVKKKLTESEDKTPFQQYLNKRKEKRKLKREERKKQLNSASAEEESDVPSDIDMNDPYFAEEFDKPEFKTKNSKTTTKKNKVENISKENNAELELLLLNENEDSKKHFNMKKIEKQEKNKTIKKKRKNVKEEKQINDEFEVDVQDERFSALFSSHHYNIDPTDSRYRKTKGMEALITEKLKRRQRDEEQDDHSTAIDIKKPKRDAELSVLVKSIKRKTHSLKNNK